MTPSMKGLAIGLALSSFLSCSGGTIEVDIATCGDGNCELGESRASCPADCTVPVLCGNNTLDPGESCDGDCPVDCDDNNACTKDTLTGSAAHCDATCIHEVVTNCVGGDGCCPPGCNADTDADCSVHCSITVAKDGTGDFSTIQAAAGAAVPGDTVCVQAGTYNEYVKIESSGVTFRAIGAVVVTYGYSSMPEWSGIFWSVNQNNIVIDGFKTVGGYTGIHLDGGDNLVVQNNFVENPYAAGIKVGWKSTNNVVVDKNIVDRTQDPAEIQYNEMISISATHGSEIRNNYVMHNSLGEAIVIKDASSFVKVFNNLCEHSTLGIYAGGCYEDAAGNSEHDIEIYNNICINNTLAQSRGGIAIACENPGLGGIPTNMTVRDNWTSGQTFGIGLSGWTSSGIPSRYGTVVFRNNKSCNNKWLDLLLTPGIPGNGAWAIDSLVNENNTVPSPCTIPTWNPQGTPSPTPPR